MRKIFGIGVVGHFRLFFGIEVVKIAEELIETMHGRQVFVEVAEVILAELPGGVSLLLEQIGDRDRFRLKTDRRGRNTNFRKSGPIDALSGNKGGSPRGA